MAPTEDQHSQRTNELTTNMTGGRRVKWTNFFGPKSTTSAEVALAPALVVVVAACGNEGRGGDGAAGSSHHHRHYLVRKSDIYYAIFGRLVRSEPG